MISPMDNPRRFLTSLFDAAVAAGRPEGVIAPFLPARPKGRVVVVGAGKASAQMAAALEAAWDGPLQGVVVTRYGFGCATQGIKVFEASHPVPDAGSVAGASALFDTVQGLGADDLVIALISGGGSALLSAPPPGVSLEDEIALTRALLASGAPIGVMNQIRKEVSLIKAGGLARAAHPAKVVSLILSDVPGDDPRAVASGPTVAPGQGGPLGYALAQEHGITLPPSIAAYLRDYEGPGPVAGFARDEAHIVGSSQLSLEAAAQLAEASGVRARILSDRTQGEAADVGREHGILAAEAQSDGPEVWLSGGEVTVTLGAPPYGRGGPNTEYLLSFAAQISETNDVFALAADTDGIDGSEDNAGAFADGATIARMQSAGIDPHEALACHDAVTAFEAIDDLFKPGPTGTNVNDFRAILRV